MSWYRTYRSQTVADLDITPVREAFSKILSSGEFSHAYLLAGPKGTGKTSAARILAKVLNCEKNRQAVEGKLHGSAQHTTHSTQKNSKHAVRSFTEPCNVCASCIAITDGSSMSVTEMDAASNRGIDDIRLLRERIGLSPPDGIISVFIIDEVHMLTTEAFNALLKVLEEPPSHVVFILATTDAQKMPATVVSRCTLIQYRKATAAELTARLQKIALAEGIDIGTESLALLATSADGSFRDAVKIFEQLAIGTKKIDHEIVATALGANASRLAADILSALLKKDTMAVVDIFSKLTTLGIDGVIFQKEVLTTAHAKLVEFASTNDKRLGILVDLMRNIAIPIEQNLPIPWMPFEIACVEYSMNGQVARSKNMVPHLESSATPIESEKQEARIKEAPEKDTAHHDQRMNEVKSEKPIVSEQRQSIEINKSQSSETSSLVEDVEVSFEKIQEQWPIVLAKIKKKSVPLEGLLRAIKLAGIEGKVVSLEATYQFHKEQMELSRNMLILEAIFEEIFGSSLRYNVKLGKAAVKIIGSPHRNVSGNTDDEKLVKAAEEAFL